MAALSVIAFLSVFVMRIVSYNPSLVPNQTNATAAAALGSLETICSDFRDSQSE